jgi:hypothetical protein
MEKRQFERITDSLDAEIVLGGISYTGIIMNFSESGLYMVTASIYNVADITNETNLDLKCYLPSKEILDLNCSVKWCQKKDSPYGTTLSMGMEIVNPPSRYREFISSF